MQRQVSRWRGETQSGAEGMILKSYNQRAKNPVCL